MLHLYIGMSILRLQPSQFSKNSLGLLHEIPEPPKELWYEGNLPPQNLHLLAVVGSRAASSYGASVVEHLISGLKGFPIGIVSGLAIGTDTLAHEAALKHGLYTLAVPGSGLDSSVLYPARNRKLAERIIQSGGGLLSELPPDSKAALWTFPRRNRIMAGLTEATLLIEASAKSGTLITARLAVDYNRELLAVPGSIFEKNREGTHQFLKLGATIVTEAKDILDVFHLEDTTPTSTLPLLNNNEQLVITLLKEQLDKDSLIRQLELPVSEANILLMNMEMEGYISYQAPFYRSLI
jgi:DNA processing protein